MEIFYRLLFGHLLADFTFQTNYIARWKRDKFAGLLVHVAIHPLCYFLLTFPYLSDPWLTVGSVSFNGWVLVPIMAFLHFVEDWVRIHLVNRGWADNTAFYLWDQAVHILVIWICSPTGTQAAMNTWPIIGILLVLVTHCATVTIWFIEKDITGREYPDTEEKYVSILQRMAVFLAFFMPFPWWIFIVGIILFSFGVHVWKRRVDFTWASVVLGNIIAVGCGFISRFGLGYHF